MHFNPEAYCSNSCVPIFRKQVTTGEAQDCTTDQYTMLVDFCCGVIGIMLGFNHAFSGFRIVTIAFMQAPPFLDFLSEYGKISLFRKGNVE